MEDDPSWFQLGASGSTTDIGQVQAALRGSSSVGQEMNSAQPFVAFGVDESLAQGLGQTRQTKRIDEEATGHDHILWLDRQGKLSRTVLKVGASKISVMTARVDISYLVRACQDGHHGQSLSTKLPGLERLLSCKTLIRKQYPSVTRPYHAAITSTSQ
jgi:hypothetical protein